MPEKISWSSEGSNKIQSFQSCKIVEEQFTLLFDQVDVEKTIFFLKNWPLGSKISAFPSSISLGNF
jgi:hypothetical protein